MAVEVHLLIDHGQTDRQKNRNHKRFTTMSEIVNKASNKRVE